MTLLAGHPAGTMVRKLLTPVVPKILPMLRSNPCWPRKKPTVNVCTISLLSYCCNSQWRENRT